jgi:hypothetical protein
VTRDLINSGGVAAIEVAAATTNMTSAIASIS